MNISNKNALSTVSIKQPLKVLVADDESLLESLILQNFAKKIKSNELVFIFAKNGKEALEIFNKDEEIGVILTDLNMPIMDGLTLLKKLAEQDRLYRTVVITAYGDMLNIRTAMNAGASDFIIKPIDFIDLEHTLNKIISQYIEFKKGLEAKFAVVELNKELNLALGIQDSMTPKDFQPFPHYANIFDIFGHIYTAKQFEGSFFDFLAIDFHRLAIFIGNSMQLGIPAALFMIMVGSLARGCALNNSSPKEVLYQINKMLGYKKELNVSGSLFFGILNMFTGELTYSNAGHPSPYIVNNEGIVTELPRGEGESFGAADPNYEELKVKLKKNESLILYTKGIIEAENKNKEIYGKERFEEYLKNSCHKNLNEIIIDIHTEIDRFLGEMPQEEDFAMLGMRINIK